jgi:PKD repeat protein
MVYFRTREYGNYIPYLEVTASEANKEPISGYSFTPFNPTIKDSIQFTDTSYDSDGTITEWFWNFGDGNSSTSRTPTHTYAQSGQYNVTLQVTDNDGITNSKTAVVSISTPKSTPGFEFLIVLSAIAFVLIVRFKWKKRN